MGPKARQPVVDCQDFCTYKERNGGCVGGGKAMEKWQIQSIVGPSELELRF